MVNKELYDQWFMQKMLTVGLILEAAFIVKFCGKTRISSLILGVPVLITFATFIIFVVVWLFLAIAFIISEKS